MIGNKYTSMSNNNIFKIAFLSALVLINSFTCNGDTLYWMVKDDPVMPIVTLERTDGTETFLCSYIQPGDDSYSVRIRVVGNGSSSILPIYDGVGWVDGTTGAWIGHDLASEGGSGWFTSGILASTLENYDESSLLFLMEIGEYLYDENSDEGFWVRTIAQSDPKTREELARFTHPGGVAVPSDIWSPTKFYEIGGGVPEPSSAILIMLGIGILSLKRRKTVQ